MVRAYICLYASVCFCYDCDDPNGSRAADAAASLYYIEIIKQTTTTTTKRLYTTFAISLSTLYSSIITINLT